MPPVSGSTLSPAEINRNWKAAQDFEAMTLSQLLTPIFDTVDLSKGPFGGGSAETNWKPMMVDALAKQIERTGGLGLAAPVFRQMLHMQEAKGAKG